MSSIYFKKGFTLVEMMVVISIIIIMLGVVLANLPAFRDRTSLDLVAQEVALVIRQAQSFGTNTRGFLASGSTEFPSYGVYFNISATSQVAYSNTSFVLFGDRLTSLDGHFSDLADNSIPCGSPASECREVYNLPGGLTFSALSLCSGGTCTTSPPLNPLSIVFARPNPEANFADYLSSASNPNNLSTACGGACSYAKITLHQQRLNQERNICIWTTGHIYTATSC